MARSYLNAADYATADPVVISGWTRFPSTDRLRVLTAGSPTQNVFYQSSLDSFANACVYRDTAITAPVVRAGWLMPNAAVAINNQKGVGLINASGNGYALIQTPTNAGTLQIRLVIAGLLQATAIATYTLASGVMNDDFFMDWTRATGEIKAYQDPDAVGSPVLRITHTDTTYTDCDHVCIISQGAASYVVSAFWEALGGAVTAIDDPIISGSSFNATVTGFSTITGVTAQGQSATNVMYLAGAVSGDWPLPTNAAPYPYLPTGSVDFTFTGGSAPATIASTISQPAGMNAVTFGTIITDDPYYLGAALVTAGYTIANVRRCYYPDTLLIYPDSRVGVISGSLPRTEEIIIHMADGNTYYEDLNLSVDGAVGVAPTMPADDSVTVSEGDTVVGTYAATAGTAPITYSLTGADSSDFSVNSSTGALTFSSPSVVGTYTVNVVATNAYGSDSTTVSVTVEAVVIVDSNVTLQAGRVEAREQLAIVRVKLAYQADSVAATVTDLRTDFNSLLSKMDTRGWFTGGEVQTTMLKVAMQNGLIQFLNRIKTQAPDQMDVQSASVAADVAALRTDFNALLTKLKAANLMATS